MNTIDRRDTILQAMLEVVAERGLHDAPMALVAKRAGASAGIIYHYFPGKEDILLALHRKIKTQAGGIFVAGDLDKLPPLEAYKRLWKNIYGFYRDNRLEAQFLEQFENSPYYGKSTITDMIRDDPNFGFIANRFGFLGGESSFRDLPLEALYEITFGTAARIAKHYQAFDAATIDAIAESCWRAVAR